MLVERLFEANPCEAQTYRGLIGLRLQGFEVGGFVNQWVGLSQVLPGGGAVMVSPAERKRCAVDTTAATSRLES